MAPIAIPSSAFELPGAFTISLYDPEAKSSTYPHWIFPSNALKRRRKKEELDDKNLRNLRTFNYPSYRAVWFGHAPINGTSPFTSTPTCVARSKAKKNGFKQSYQSFIKFLIALPIPTFATKSWQTGKKFVRPQRGNLIFTDHPVNGVVALQISTAASHLLLWFHSSTNMQTRALPHSGVMSQRHAAGPKISPEDLLSHFLQDIDGKAKVSTLFHDLDLLGIFSLRYMSSAKRASLRTAADAIQQTLEGGNSRRWGGGNAGGESAGGAGGSKGGASGSASGASGSASRQEYKDGEGEGDDVKAISRVDY
ncbi:hypothetical protein B0H16DRAFT_1446613 [Mycena metata]|uniref:Uncharacterized protein n=1 Tax=Mycena metata TaxID=1033252 RepID=A0AAD7P1Y2_9AGAR|nr:hypothetical protein B0H16DRAFT_1446613 [Mycena metata]